MSSSLLYINVHIVIDIFKSVFYIYVRSVSPYVRDALFVNIGTLELSYQFQTFKDYFIYICYILESNSIINDCHKVSVSILSILIFSFLIYSFRHIRNVPSSSNTVWGFLIQIKVKCEKRYNFDQISSVPFKHVDWIYFMYCIWNNCPVTMIFLNDDS